ncbi:MAG: twin-arginine translocase subunit TatC [Chloroflexota bacterium]
MSWRSAVGWRRMAGLRGVFAAVWPAVDVERRMPLADHLAELRRRLILSLFALAAGTILTWGSLPRLYSWLARPAGSPTLISLSPGEGFATDLRLALFGGCCLALPVWLVQAALFVAPALSGAARRRLPQYIAGVLLLACGGAAAGYLVVLPAALRFLLGRGATAAATIRAAAVLSLSRYTSFVLTSVLATVVAAEIPVVLLALAQLGLIRADTLRRRRRQGWLLMVVGAAVLTPSTDAVTLVLLAGPLILLYEVTLLLMKAVRA